MRTALIDPEGRDKSHRAAASQFFVAAELCRQELVAVLTLGNCPNTDILVSNKGGTAFAHVQVKTFVPGGKTCSVGLKAEEDYGSRFFWVLAGIATKVGGENQYYIIPADVMCREIRSRHKVWLDTPGKGGKKHNDTSIRTVLMPPHAREGRWDVSRYLNRWDLVAACLKSKGQ